jgi:hypothetical protein
MRPETPEISAPRAGALKGARKPRRPLREAPSRPCVVWAVAVDLTCSSRVVVDLLF